MIPFVSGSLFGEAPWQTLSETIDVSGLIDAAGVAGRDLIVTLQSNDDNSTFNYIFDPVIKVETTPQGPAPTISGTQARQTLTAGMTDTPFSHVTLADPANPGGAGDEISITVLDTGAGAGDGSSDAQGMLSGAGLTSYGDGNYTLNASSLTALQSDLQALVFSSYQFSGTTSASLAFELDFQSTSGRTADNETTTLDISPACYCRGTLILTEDGERPVEELAIGQMVVTAAGIHRPVRWIGRRRYAGRLLRANPACQPVRFRAGALGPDLPRRDLLVSQKHSMLLDGLLVPAVQLLNGTTVVTEQTERVDYFHVELDSHDILLAEGVPSESFMDDGNRGIFHNAAEFAALHPNAPKADGFCAPRVESGFQVEAIRVRLAEAARPLASAA